MSARAVLVVKDRRIVADISGKITRRKQHAPLADGARAYPCYGASILVGQWSRVSMSSATSVGAYTVSRGVFLMDSPSFPIYFQMKHDEHGNLVDAMMEVSR